MSTFHFRVLPFAAIVLLTGNSAFAQTANSIKQENDSKQVQLFAQDVSTYVSEEAYALPWVQIPMKNVVWQKRAWREIDATDPANKAFGNDAANQRKSYLVNILLQAAIDGKIKAYDAVNDRFTKQLTRDELIALINTGAGFNPDHVSKYQIKEDWLFLKEENKIVERILGIAPVAEVRGPNGNITERALFWVYVPDNRDFLAQQKVLNEDMNWDEVLAGRKYSSKIIKVKDAPIRVK